MVLNPLANRLSPAAVSTTRMSRTVSLVTCAMRVMSVSARSIDRRMLLAELLQLLGHRPGEYPADPAREARVEPADR